MTADICVLGGLAYVMVFDSDLWLDGFLADRLFDAFPTLHFCISVALRTALLTPPGTSSGEGFLGLFLGQVLPVWGCPPAAGSLSHPSQHLCPWPSEGWVPDTQQCRFPVHVVVLDLGGSFQLNVFLFTKPFSLLTVSL